MLTKFLGQFWGKTVSGDSPGPVPLQFRISSQAADFIGLDRRFQFRHREERRARTAGRRRSTGGRSRQQARRLSHGRLYDLCEEQAVPQVSRDQVLPCADAESDPPAARPGRAVGECGTERAVADSFGHAEPAGAADDGDPHNRRGAAALSQKEKEFYRHAGRPAKDVRRPRAGGVLVMQ